MTYKDSIYNHYRSGFKGEATKESLQFGAEKIRPVLEPWINGLNLSSPILDLGCGAGELLLSLRYLGFTNLAGCDLSAEQVKVAKNEFPLVVECDLFTYLEQHPDNSIELVTIFDVIEHLKRQETFDLMSLAYRKLRPGGRFIAHLPNGLSPFVGHDFWGDMTHEWCLTPQSASTLCTLHGFQNFEAVEHLGASKNLKGRFRRLAWTLIRKGFQLLNAIETGGSGGSVWTRNFAFKADKPVSNG